MSADQRLREAVRSYVASLPIPPRPDLSTVVGHALETRPRRARLAPVAAGVAMCLLLVAVFATPGVYVMWLPAQPGAGGAAPATLPDEIAGYSYLTGDVSSAPPGRAIALYQQGYGVELFDFPQALVLGADDDVYRRVDLAEDRGGATAQGDPAPMLLAPDGDRVAIGTYSAAADLAILDLGTGKWYTIDTEDGWNVAPLAWSPDGRYVAALVGEEQALTPFSGTPADRPIVLFDLELRRQIRLPPTLVGSALAFSPDGTELAVGLGAQVIIVDRTGTERRRLDLPVPYELTSSVAWSPDGRLLAVHNHGSTNGGPRVAFVDATGVVSAAAQVPRPLTFVSSQPVGWTAPDRVLVRTPGSNSFNDNEIVEVELRSGERRRLTHVDTGPADNYQVGAMYLATGLLDGLQVREAGWSNRGPWPLWLRVFTGAVIFLVAWWMVRPMLRRRRRLRALAVSPSCAQPASQSPE